MEKVKKYAVLIDADNISPDRFEKIFEEISRLGIATYRRIYGNWADYNRSMLKDKLLKYALTPVQQFSYISGKNATDITMVIDAMDILYSGDVDGFCLVTNDSDFCRLALRLRESGADVIGMGDDVSPMSFRYSCTDFIILRETRKEADERREAKRQRLLERKVQIKARFPSPLKKNGEPEINPSEENSDEPIHMGVAELLADDEDYSEFLNADEESDEPVAVIPEVAVLPENEPATDKKAADTVKETRKPRTFARSIQKHIPKLLEKPAVTETEKAEEPESEKKPETDVNGKILSDRELREEIKSILASSKAEDGWTGSSNIVNVLKLRHPELEIKDYADLPLFAGKRKIWSTYFLSLGFCENRMVRHGEYEFRLVKEDTYKAPSVSASAVSEPAPVYEPKSLESASAETVSSEKTEKPEKAEKSEKPRKTVRRPRKKASEDVSAEVKSEEATTETVQPAAVADTEPAPAQNTKPEEEKKPEEKKAETENAVSEKAPKKRRTASEKPKITLEAASENPVEKSETKDESKPEEKADGKENAKKPARKRKVKTQL